MKSVEYLSTLAHHLNDKTLNQRLLNILILFSHKNENKYSLIPQHFIKFILLLKLNSFDHKILINSHMI